jgi:cytochrome c peroxidase
MVTKTPSDEFVFKVPTLRNIELTPPTFIPARRGSGPGGRGDGREPARHPVDRRGDGQDHGLPSLLTGEQPQVTYPLLPPARWIHRTPRCSRVLFSARTLRAGEPQCASASSSAIQGLPVLTA